MVSFTAQELNADGSFGRASYAFSGNEKKGFLVEREGKLHLELPPGYRLLRTEACGVCSTDLARRFLPFPLPQIIGHEILARDEKGRLVACEINASHAALGSPEGAACPRCSAGHSKHCQDRLVLGIDRLPGGFGPYVLVPKNNNIPVPKGMLPDTAVLAEPFAAALHAVETIEPDRAGSIAVLGAGKLGLLIVAALRALRDRGGFSFSITAVEQNPVRASTARRLGADKVLSGTPGPDSADIAVEATGSPKGLELALEIARREVHVKSTTGQKTLGLEHLTEMVVDEVSLAVLGKGDTPPAGAVVATSLKEIDSALRPRPDSREGLVPPRGVIYIDARKAEPGGLLGPLVSKNLRITTSRCGDFAKAFPIMEELWKNGIDLGGLIVTHHVPAGHMPAVVKTALLPEAVKVVVEH